MVAGDFVDRVTPVPIPNTEVSLLEPMVLRGKLCGRVGSRRDQFKSPLESLSRAGFFVGWFR